MAAPTTRNGGTYHYYGQQLNAVAADASEANRTITLSDLKFEESLDVHIDISQDSGTAVTVTPYWDPGDGTYRQTVSRDIDAGTGTLSLYSDSLAISGDTSFCVSYDCSRAEGMKFIVAVTNGVTADTITAYVTAAKSAARG